MTNTPATSEEVERAARLAGWTPEMGPMPTGHGLPPEDDPELGNNGVSAPKPGDADFPEVNL